MVGVLCGARDIARERDEMKKYFEHTVRLTLSHRRGLPPNTALNQIEIFVSVRQLRLFANYQTGELQDLTDNDNPGAKN